MNTEATGAATLQLGEPKELTEFAPGEYMERFRTTESIRVPRPVWALAFLIVIGIGLTIAFLFLTPWVQTANGFGQVTTLDPAERTQNIAALTSGRINKWYVRDGSHVNQGDPIVEIIDLDPRFIENLEAERSAIASRVAAAESATATARLDLERQRRLLDQGLTSRLGLENAQIRYQELLAAESEARASLNQVEMNLSRQSIQTVVAPRDGTVVQIYAGDTATLVDAGQTVASFVPDTGELVVELFVSGLDAALIEPGRDVMLQFEGWPAVQSGGWPAVAIGTFRGIVYAVDPVVSANGRFRVLVTEKPNSDRWPSRRYLRFGTQARGWVLLEEVNVGYELWRRLNGFPPNQTAGPGASNAGTNGV